MHRTYLVFKVAIPLNSRLIEARLIVRYILVVVRVEVLRIAQQFHLRVRRRWTLMNSMNSTNRDPLGELFSLDREMVNGINSQKRLFSFSYPFEQNLSYDDTNYLFALVLNNRNSMTDIERHRKATMIPTPMNSLNYFSRICFHSKFKLDTDKVGWDVALGISREQPSPYDIDSIANCIIELFELEFTITDLDAVECNYLPSVFDFDA